jgi:uncharacterized protein
MDAFVIDAFEFCRLAERREGEIAVADMKRLSAECVDVATSLHWTLQGGANSLGYPQLVMAVAGAIHLRCQRCMTSLEYVIESEQVLVLAKSNEQADEIEAQLDDDTIDVIVGMKAMNILDLVEDEALLSLPLAPKHDVCPGNAATEGLSDVRKPSPFDVLKGLKQ